MATHSSVLAWRIPGTGEPGGLPSMGSHRVGHDWVTSLSLFTFMHWRRKWQPIPVFLPGESQGRGACWAAAYGVAQSQTWLKRLSSSRMVFKYICKLSGGHGILTFLAICTSLEDRSITTPKLSEWEKEKENPLTPFAVTSSLFVQRIRYSISGNKILHLNKVEIY